MSSFSRYLLWFAAVQNGLRVAAGGNPVNNGADLSRHLLNSSSTSSTYSDTYVWGPLPDPTPSASTTESSSFSSLGATTTNLPIPQETASITPITSPTEAAPTTPPLVSTSSSNSSPSSKVDSTIPSPLPTLGPTLPTAAPISLLVPTLPPVVGTGLPWNNSVIPPVSVKPPHGHQNSSISLIIYTITSDFSPVPTISSCSTLKPGQPVTSWIILPNTTTTTITVTRNESMTFTKTPEFTPPTYCTSWTLTASSAATTTASQITSAAESSGIVPVFTSLPFTIPRLTTTIITTSKNPVTVFTTASIPLYGGNTDTRAPGTPTSYTDTYIWGPLPEPTDQSGGATTDGGSDASNTGGGSGPPHTTDNPGPANTVGGSAPPNPTNGPGPANTVGGSASPNPTVGSGTPSTTLVTPGSQVITTDNSGTGSTPGSGPVVVPGPTHSHTLVQASPGSIAPNAPYTTVYNGGGTDPGPITQTVGSVTVIVSSTQVVVGEQTVSLGGGDKTLTESGETFTVNPTQVIGPSIIINVPTSIGGQFMQSPTPTTVQGISIDISPSTVVIAGTSYSIGVGAPVETIVAKGQTITIGTAGVIFSATTVTPPEGSPTNVVIVDGQVFSAIGSNTAVIGGSTFTYSPGLPPQTEVFNGETITIGPQGVSFEGTTLGGIANPTGTELGIAGGVSVTEIGSTLAIINGQTLTLGPGTPTTTLVISGQTIVVGPTGLSVGGATLTAPFNVPTQPITAGGITFSEVGSSLAVIGSKTFTFGPGATATSDVYNGQTISIGPSGIGFATTTFTAATRVPTVAPSHTKNGGERLALGTGVLRICVVMALVL